MGTKQQTIDVLDESLPKSSTRTRARSIDPIAKKLGSHISKKLQQQHHSVLPQGMVPGGGGGGGRQAYDDDDDRVLSPSQK